MGGSLRRQGQRCRASPMRSDESTWQLGLAKATISSSSSSAGIFLPSTWGRSCRGPHLPPAGIDHRKIADAGEGLRAPLDDCWMGWGPQTLVHCGGALKGPALVRSWQDSTEGIARLQEHYQGGAHSTQAMSGRAIATEYSQLPKMGGRHDMVLR